MAEVIVLYVVMLVCRQRLFHIHRKYVTAAEKESPI